MLVTLEREIYSQDLFIDSYQARPVDFKTMPGAVIRRSQSSPHGNANDVDCPVLYVTSYYIKQTSSQPLSRVRIALESIILSKLIQKVEIILKRSIKCSPTNLNI